MSGPQKTNFGQRKIWNSKNVYKKTVIDEHESDKKTCSELIEIWSGITWNHPKPMKT